MSDERHRQLIEKAAAQHGLTVDRWDEDDVDGVIANFGQWTVIEEDEDRGLYDGDDGELTAQVVGSLENRNERVAFAFTGEGFDPYSGPEVVPFEEIEPT